MNTMKILHAVILCGILGAAAALGACEHRVVETTKTEQTPNGTKTEKKTVTEHPDGTVTEEKKTTETH